MTVQQNPVRRRADGSIDTDHYARLSFDLRRRAIAGTPKRWVHGVLSWLASQLDRSGNNHFAPPLA
jgi:hypothetical protein